METIMLVVKKSNFCFFVYSLLYIFSLTLIKTISLLDQAMR